MCRERRKGERLRPIIDVFFFFWKNDNKENKWWESERASKRDVLVQYNEILVDGMQ